MAGRTYVPNETREVDSECKCSVYGKKPEMVHISLPNVVTKAPITELITPKNGIATETSKITPATTYRASTLIQKAFASMPRSFSHTWYNDPTKRPYATNSWMHMRVAAALCAGEDSNKVKALPWSAAVIPKEWYPVIPDGRAIALT